MWGIFLKSHGKQRKSRRPRVLTSPRQNPQQIEMKIPPRDFPQQPGTPHAELGDAPSSPKGAASTSPPGQQAQSKCRKLSKAFTQGACSASLGWLTPITYTQTAAQHRRDSLKLPDRQINRLQL